ncbi:MAG: MMPL family transporter [Verrucomicrobia bacterium]|nr:MMPL family transporter [Verrucomicrobiota bacterium]
MRRGLRMYDRTVLHHPAQVLIASALIFAAFGLGIRNFRLDASADSLILENDPDLLYLEEIEARYGTSEFVLVTFTPSGGSLFTKSSLDHLQRLSGELELVEQVDSVVSILDVPLLRNPPVPLSEIKNNIKHLGSPEVDLALAEQEFDESPLFKKYLVSEDLKSTSLLVTFRPDETLQGLADERAHWKDAARAGSLSRAERLQQRETEAAYRTGKNRADRQRKGTIAEIRSILSRYQPEGTHYLGGIPMIADDMLTFIRSDLKIFGIGILLFLLLTLGCIFRQVRWVLLPMLCCLLSVTVMMGLLGIFRWEVTVVSSNFISLQMIVTMALAIHIAVRYTELLANHPARDKHALIAETVRTIARPCLYTTTTTIAGFSSLVFCDILPVINFGWMMAAGLTVSLLVTFIVMPASLALLPRLPPVRHKPFGTRFTRMMASFTQNHARLIGLISIAVVALTVVGTLNLKVENSFINYFRRNTEISKGMQFIDRNLGGTTPLEIIVDFGGNEAPSIAAAGEPADADFFDEFDEFETDANHEKYWYTPDKLDCIGEVHRYLDARPEVGKVLSLHTVMEFAQWLNGGETLDGLGTILLFNELPEDFRDIVLSPYVSVEDNQARVSVRIEDSLKDLRRDQLLRDIKRDLGAELGDRPEQIHLTGVMVLYNNMLQSLFESQFQTIGITVLAIMLMFLVLFQSVKVSLIAIVPNLIASLTVLGVMGLLDIPLDMMTITIVAISIGIAVDNTIHYLHRFRREFEVDGDYIATMHRCHSSIGRALYYTSFTIVVGFSILAFSNFIPTVLFGLFTGLAIAMALLAALTLLPVMIIRFKPFGNGQSKRQENNG